MGTVTAAVIYQPPSIIYRIEDIPDELSFRHRSCETSNYLSIFEHEINRLSYNPIFLDCLPILIIVQPCNSECIPVLFGNFGDNWRHLLAGRSPIRIKFNHDGYF